MTGRRIRALDSIRAIAVVFTVGVHMPGSPISAGGRAMFFVLSGFLIGGMLLRQAEAGKLHLLKFWAARARRLFPALLVLLIAGLAFIRLAPSAADYEQWAQEGFWAALYGHNFYLMSIQDDYFDDLLPSPLEHIWSLSAEEQFYVLFPFVVLAAMGIARLWRGSPASGQMSRVRKSLLGICLAGMVASGLFAQATSGVDAAAWAYYDLRARAGALFAGVVLACLFTDAARERVSTWRPAILNTAGVVALAAALAVMFGPDSRTFYLQFGIPILVLVTLVLIVVAYTHTGVSRALSIKPVVGLGLISYGVYLWAIPIGALWGETAARRGTPLALVWVVCAVTTIVAAIASYKLIEMPVRDSKFLAQRPIFTLVSGIGALAVVAALYALLPSPYTTGPAISVSAASPGSSAVQEIKLEPCAFDPSGAGGQLGCVIYEPTQEPSATILTVGGSNIQHLQPGLVNEARARNWRILAATGYVCPLTFYEEGSNEYWPTWLVPNAVCAEAEDSAMALVKSGLVDLVLALDMSNVGALLEAPDGQAQLARLQEGYRETFRTWTEHSKLLLILDYPTLDAPGTPDLRTPPEVDHFSRDLIEGGAYINESRTFLTQALPPEARYMDLLPLVCPNSWPCPWDKDGVQLRRDQTHFTVEGSNIAAPLIAREIESLLTQPTPAG